MSTDEITVALCDIRDAVSDNVAPDHPDHETVVSALGNIAKSIDCVLDADAESLVAYIADGLRTTDWSVPRGEGGKETEHGESMTLADAVMIGGKRIGRALELLGNADASTPMGAIEAHGLAVKESGDAVRDGLDGGGTTIREGLLSVASSIDDLANAYREHGSMSSLKAEIAMEQAVTTAAYYMDGAIRHIDEKFGKGYAAKHPELVGAFMQACAADFDTTSQVKALT